MNYESLNFILKEQTKGNYAVISESVRIMSDEEYNKIPVLELTKEQFNFVNSYGVSDTPVRELDNFVNGKSYYQIFYVAPTLFKVLCENKNINNG